MKSIIEKYIFNHFTININKLTISKEKEITEYDNDEIMNHEIIMNDEIKNPRNIFETLKQSQYFTSKLL